jgi:hypothetical protein
LTGDDGLLVALEHDETLLALEHEGLFRALLVNDDCDRALIIGRRFSGAGCCGRCAITGGEGVLEDGVPLRVASIRANVKMRR